jgi:DNA adenine methylase
MISEVKGLRLGNDINTHLVKLLEALSEGWVPDDYVDKATYEDVKKHPEIYPPHFVGWCGVCCSYSGKWFGGFAGKVQTKQGVRNYQLEAKNNVLRQSKKLKGVVWSSTTFDNLDVSKSDLVYCDPPYLGTTKYRSDFDHEKFYGWVRDLSELGINVLISEYVMPDDFVEIWSKPVKSSLSANGKIGGNKASIERLFVHESNPLALF